jgi:hypothetical protein
MPCRSIADILRGMGEIPPSELPVCTGISAEPIDTADDPPVAPARTPWIQLDRIRAANSREVRERIERGTGDDRPSWERRAEAREAWALVNAAQRVKWRFTFSPKAAAKPRPKKERTAEQRERNREQAKLAMRGLRARRKADASVNLQGA